MSNKDKGCRVGIYMLWSKTFPEVFYIGASADLKTREIVHARKTSCHTKIQDHINKFGADDLCFEVIDECSADELQYMEQYYISELSPPLNTFKFASGWDNATLAKRAALEDINNPLFCKEKQLLELCDRAIFPETIISI